MFLICISNCVVDHKHSVCTCVPFVGGNVSTHDYQNALSNHCVNCSKFIGFFSGSGILESISSIFCFLVDKCSLKTRLSTNCSNSSRLLMVELSSRSYRSKA